ncbi:hypothetical protein ACLB2K_062463 [Fragaria x ananassa]
MASQNQEPTPTALVKGKWTPDEDEKLIEAVALHGAKNWTSIASKAVDEKPSVADDDQKVHVEMKQECLAAVADTSAALIKKEEKIPKKFVMKYRKDLSDSVYLKLPSGSKWEVELIRSRGKIWFEKGWPEFSIFCSIDYGSFMLFRYEGNSHFHVCICDMSATEIDYPRTMPKIEEADEDDDLSIETLEDFQSSPKTRRKYLFPYPPYKKMRTSLSGENGFLTKRDGGSSSGCQKFLKKIYEILGRMKPLIATEKANAFNSVNPSFRIAIHPYSIRYECVSLPNEFTRRYLMNLPAGIVKLRVPDGRTWGNSLKDGDVCIFTLINCIELLFEVVFFHTKDSANCPSSTGHGRGASVQVEEKKHPILEVEPDCSLDCKIGKNNLSKISGQVTQMPSSSLRTSRVNLEAASKFSSKNHFFKFIMGSGHTVHIPANFSRSFIKYEKQTAILHVKNRSWHVN